MEDRDGLAIGVVPPGTSVEAWADEMRVHADRRAQNLASADYSEGSELMRSLVLAAEHAAKLAALRRPSAGE